MRVFSATGALPNFANLGDRCCRCEILERSGCSHFSIDCAKPVLMFDHQSRSTIMPKRHRDTVDINGLSREGSPGDDDDLLNEKENREVDVASAMSSLRQAHLSFSRAYLKIKNRMDELNAAYAENTQDIGEEIAAFDDELEFFWDLYVKMIEQKNQLRETWEKNSEPSVPASKRSRRNSPVGEAKARAELRMIESSSYPKVVEEKDDQATPGLDLTTPKVLSPFSRRSLSTPLSSMQRHSFCFYSPEQTPKSPFHSPALSALQHSNIKSTEKSTPTSSSSQDVDFKTPSVTQLAAEGIQKLLKSASVVNKSEMVVASSGPKCVLKKEPLPARFMGDIQKFESMELPEFRSLCNYSESQFANADIPKGMKVCVMCGKACPCSKGHKVKSKKKANDGDDPCIPSQNKGLCTLCDVRVWVITGCGTEIKWCKGCKNFKPWAAFGYKGSGTKCVPCRERLREMYARSKERAQQKLLKTC